MIVVVGAAVGAWLTAAMTVPEFSRDRVPVTRPTPVDVTGAKLATEIAKLHERLHPDAPDIAAQVVFAGREEWATSADDVLHRRTTLAARGLTGPDVTSRIDSLLGLTVRR